MRARTVVALAAGLTLLAVIAACIGINISNDSHRRRVTRNVVASLRPGMTVDQAQAVFILHGLDYSRDESHIGAMVRTPKGSIKLIHTDCHITVTLSPQGLITDIQTKDVHTGW